MQSLKSQYKCSLARHLTQFAKCSYLVKNGIDFLCQFHWWMCFKCVKGKQDDEVSSVKHIAKAFHGKI